MKIYPFDRPLVKLLVEKKQHTQAIPPEKRNSELSGWGILFLDLFRDINESLSFSVADGSVNVHVGDDTIPHGKDFNEETYMHYNQTMDLQVKVLQRFMLLRQLEENRLIVWVNSGKRTANFNYEDKFFYLINEEDKQLVRDRFNYEAVATEELVELVKNGFVDDETKRHNQSINVAWAGVIVAIVIGIASIVLNILMLCHNC